MTKNDPSDGSDPTADMFSSSFIKMLEIFSEQWLDKAGAYTPEHLAAPFEELARTCVDPSAMMPIVGMLNQACLHWMTGGMRSAGRITQAVAQWQARFVDHVGRSAAGGASNDEIARLLIDDARACLRQITEAAEEEARAFRSNVTTLDDALRALAGDQPEPDTGGRRRWKVKQ